MTVKEIIAEHSPADKWEIREIVLKYLTENGYDGLYTDDFKGSSVSESCACGKDNLLECGDFELCKDCESGYEFPSTDSEFDVMIGSKEDMAQAEVTLKEQEEDENEGVK